MNINEKRMVIFAIVVVGFWIGLTIFNAGKNLVRISSTPTRNEYKKYDYVLEKYKNYARSRKSIE